MIVSNRPRAAVVLFMGVILLVVAASRISRLDDLKMNPDEIWAVWQTLGSPAQIVQWTPYDWPPLYYLLLGAWRGLAGLHPVILRYASVLMFVLGTACLYRAARRLAGDRAANLVVLGYAALGYAVLLSIEVRGYAPLMGLMPLAFWLTLRYFDHPGWKRAIPLGIVLAAMFYTSLTSIGAFFALGLYTLVVYRRAVWRWWLPGLCATVLALPEIVAKSQIAVERTTATVQLALPPLSDAIINIFRQWAGYPFVVWVFLFAVGIAALAPSREFNWSSMVALLLWALGTPVLLYVLNPAMGFFSARYAWWVMMGIALLVGIGLSRLPHQAGLAAGAALTSMAFSALPVSQYNIFENLSELGVNFTWLQKHLIPGDVLVADPNNRCGGAEEWDYYIRTFFPNGLTFVDDPTSYRRVWYVQFDGQQDSQLQKAVAEGRAMGEFVGPPGCLFRLYEAPPDTRGILFENGMRFHGADVIQNGLPWSGPLVRHEGESIRLRLWWSVDEPVSLDYSVGVYIVTSGGTPFASSDSAPQVISPSNAPQETSRWTPENIYVEERELALPVTMPRTTFIALVVYFWQDGKRIPAPGINESGLLILRKLSIKSW